MASCPPCFFSVKNFKAWQRKAVERGEDPENYCRDCSLKYQQRMIALNRCRHPEVTFVELPNDDDGELEVVGVLPDAKE